MKGVLYKAKRISDGEIVKGSLIHKPGSVFVYIAEIDTLTHMTVNEEDGSVNDLKLTRVMGHTVEIAHDSGLNEDEMKQLISTLSAFKNDTSTSQEREAVNKVMRLVDDIMCEKHGN